MPSLDHQHRAAVMAAVLLTLAVGASAAHSQAANDANPKPADTPTALGDALPTEHLTGDWGGWRTRLSNAGVDLTPSYTSETAAVVSGGRRRGVDYAHNIGMEADVDWGKLAGLQGFSTHIDMIERAGRNASTDYVGERLTEVQEIYGSGGDVGVHLGYLYAEQKLLSGKLDLQAGRLDVGQDFDTSPLYCEFMNLTVCPEPRSLTLQSGFTIFPTSTWGTRLRAQPFETTYVQIGAFQVRPAGGGRSGLDFSTTRTTGALIPLEVGVEPQFGPNRLVGHYKLGAIYNTSSVKDLWEGESGQPFVGTGSAARSHRGQASFYGAADQMLLRTGPDGTDGIIILAGYSHEDPHTSVVEQQASAGILASGVIPGRPKDSIGFQTTWFKVSNELTATQELESQLGAPLSSGLSTITYSPSGIQGHETVLEGRYDIRVVEGLHLMPDLQYVIRPDGSAHYSDATVLALRVTANF